MPDISVNISTMVSYIKWKIVNTNETIYYS